MRPVYFSDQWEFRKWLAKNHNKKSELLAGYYKKGSGIPGMTWPESVDQALCFGWIDGIRRSVDGERYCIRFTPRRASSVWSEINIRKMKKLIKLGLMEPSGYDIFKLRKKENSKRYSFENDPEILPENLERKFKSSKKAWNFFSEQSPSYRKMVIRWVMDAKRDITRTSRIGKAVAVSANGERLFNNKKK
jgi:uncharacterized protein YdeI (YjbR/CyaY-like superfamily)